MNKIIEYIRRNYEPASIIVYGSYADGSNNENSDFDALVISKNQIEMHDVSFVEGIQLDVFVYPFSYFDGEIDCDEFIQIHDGIIAMDTDDIGLKLKHHVLNYIDNFPCKTKEEIRTEVEWCRKMLLRAKRNDAEGMFRWHWLLTESLEIYCDVMEQRYWGPKKSLRWMAEEQPEAYEIYARALYHMDEDAVEQWIAYLGKVL